MNSFSFEILPQNLKFIKKREIKYLMGHNYKLFSILYFFESLIDIFIKSDLIFLRLFIILIDSFAKFALFVSFFLNQLRLIKYIYSYIY